MFIYTDLERPSVPAPFHKATFTTDVPLNKTLLFGCLERSNAMVRLGKVKVILSIRIVRERFLKIVENDLSRVICQICI